MTISFFCSLTLSVLNKMFILDYSFAHRLFHSFFDVLIEEMKAGGIVARKGRWTSAPLMRPGIIWGLSWNACEHLNSLPKRYFVVQTEPLVVREKYDKRWPKLECLLKHATFVFDYYLEGHKPWYDRWDTPAFELPLRYSSQFSRAIRFSYVPRITQTCDVLFYGCTSPRRDALVQSLKKKGLRVIYGVIKGEKRDRLIQGASIVISSGAKDEHVEGNVDAFRIMPLLSAGVFVIAEENPRAMFFKILKAEGLVCGSYEELPSLCKTWIDNGKVARSRVTSSILEYISQEFRMDEGFRTWHSPIKEKSLKK